MAQQGAGFDMSKMGTADKILLLGGIVFVVDGFLPWQRVCFDFLGVSECASAKIWEGNGSFLGWIAMLFAVVLVIWSALGAMGNAPDVGIPAAKVSGYLGLGAFVAGVLKFILVITNEIGFGAFVGLVLAIALAYGGWMKLQEPGGVAPSAGGEGGSFSG